MARYIDADKLILSMRRCAGEERSKKATTNWADACESFIDEIEDLLVDDKEDVASVVHGKWIERWHENKHIIGDMACSVCEAQMSLTFPKYCPNCGAKMDTQ